MSARNARAHWMRGAVVVAAGFAAPAAFHAVHHAAEARVLLDAGRTVSFTQAPGDSRRAGPADSADVAAFLSAVRGAHPLMCDLASRVVDGNFGWGNWRDHGPGIVGDEQVRALARATLDRKPREADISTLRTALSDPDACVRRMAAPLLGRIESPRAVEALTAALRDPSETTREMAALGLGVGEPPSALQPLIASLGDASPRVRAMAAWALGELENPAAIPGLSALLRDANPRVRRAAARALGEIEDPAAIPALTNLLRDDRDPDVRRAAAWALGEISG